MSHPQYIGRFAPSPSGPLHFGSLVAALASFLDAKHHAGKWLVRIEDIDPPREEKGADKLILKTLEAFNLYWDDSVLYQSERHDAYREQLNSWLSSGDAFACECTRKQIKQQGGHYYGFCRDKGLPKEGHAIRFKHQDATLSFNDCYLGHYQADINQAKEDFLIHRRDGLFAYQLAVVMDDSFQNISHVIRGADLLPTTVWQIDLFKALKAKLPTFGHVPLMMAADGRKLSKQNHAPALDISQSSALLFDALIALKQQPPKALIHENNQTILDWAIINWQNPYK
ncbi:tRNA glutamyl-Q(34) synthetase GluQRS [Catenovulum sp. SM1970]|uniref:tRNA glutamyl-Q(34) synthetase GluQRS n=1 Tax=Marinifaba aquimaris TaxID=2741323 RepID=UPI00157488E7|nr:tRNA glutamyl-Q(34) synthetase GluQRS [Marinifaba aquimaris]NTS75591.1 tRNA glutamyl-Q(34) synthetase GluQRS [Marinifaba aquimaris]